MAQARDARSKSESESESEEEASDGTQPSNRPSGKQGEQGEYDEVVWIPLAALSGIFGAFIVALIFLGVDLISGRPPLWTPALLGSALFRGESIGANDDPMTMLPLVVGYTVLHGVAFFAFAIGIGSSRLASRPAEIFTLRSAARVALLTFIGLHLLFLALGWISGSGLAIARRLGFAWIAVANAVATIGMVAVIEWGVIQLRTTARADAEARQSR
jgi:hypothetical protein